MRAEPSKGVRPAPEGERTTVVPGLDLISNSEEVAIVTILGTITLSNYGARRLALHLIRASRRRI